MIQQPPGLKRLFLHVHTLEWNEVFPMPELSVLTFLIVCPLLFLAGLVDAVAGGGGLISLPAYLLAGLPPHLATATNKCSSTFGTLLATVRYLRRGKLHRQSAALSVACALAGSWVGARLNLWVPERFLYLFLLACLPVIAVILFFRRKAVDEDHTDRYTSAGLLTRVGAIALVIGRYDGFFGPGTGTFLMLALTTLCGFDLLTASGNTKLINLSSNLAAFVTFALSGSILWTLGIPAALFNIAGNYLGSGLALRRGAAVIRPMMLTVLLLLLGTVVYDLGWQ